MELELKWTVTCLCHQMLANLISLAIALQPVPVKWEKYINNYYDVKLMRAINQDYMYINALSAVSIN